MKRTFLLCALGLCLSGCPSQSGSPPATSTSPTSSPSGESAADGRGRALYGQHCAVCHQADGRGVMGAYPPLDGSEWLADSSQASIAIVLKGVEGPLTVKGETFQGQMPPLGETLKDEEIAEILTYVRSSWSNSAPAVEVTTVSQLRQTLTKQVGPWNGEEELLDYLGDQAPER